MAKPRRAPRKKAVKKKSAAPRGRAAALPPGADPEVCAVVRKIPRGKVATYGQIAELIGRPGAHRFVARAMRSCPASLPWQRVVGRHDARRAHISIVEPQHAAEQRKRLLAEGVVFDDAGLISLRKSGWLPG